MLASQRATHTKPNKRKSDSPRPETNIQKLVNAFAVTYQERVNQPMAIKWGQFSKQAKDLLVSVAKGMDQSVEPELLESAAADHIKSMIPFYFDTTKTEWWDFSAFAANFNKLQAKVNAKDNTASDRYAKVRI